MTFLTVVAVTAYCLYEKKIKSRQKLAIPTYTPSSLINSTTYDKGELLAKQIFYSPSEFSACTVSTSDEGEHYSSPIYPTESEQIYETPHPPSQLLGSNLPKMALVDGVEPVLALNGFCRVLPYSCVTAER